MSPIEIFKNAQRQLPSLKFANGLLGLAAAGATILSLINQHANPYILIGSVFIGTILVFSFSLAVTSGVVGGGYAASLLVWSINIFFIVFLTFTAMAFWSGLPCNWAKFISVDSAPECRERRFKPDFTDDTPPNRSSKSHEVSAFTYDAITADGPSSQRWERQPDGQWIENYPNNIVNNPNYFTRLKRINYSGCDGIVISKIGDNLQVFIADKDCPNKNLKFRTLPENKWHSLPPMYNVN